MSVSKSFRLTTAACLSAVLFFLPSTASFSAPPGTRLVEGLRDHTPQIHAFVGGRIVVAPGRVIEKGTLVVRDGVIEAVGVDAPTPADAKIWNVAGKTLYPGLIDGFAETRLGTEPLKQGAPHSNSLVAAQLDVAKQLHANSDLNEKLRSQGITARLLAPEAGIIKGASAVVTTGDDSAEQVILKSQVAQHVHLYVSRNPRRDTYPNSPMGAVALARQTFYDAAWYRSAWNAFRANPKLPRPERNDALEVLQHLADDNQLVIFDADNELYFLRAERFAREFSLNAAMRGSGREYRQLAEVVATGRPVIVPVAFPKPPNVSTAEAVLNASIEDLLHWDLAPENPGRLEKEGVRILLSSHGLKEPKEFLPAVRRAVERGLSADGALRALTLDPAELYGVSDRIGSLEARKAANFIITNGDLFAKETKIIETWVDGQRYEITKSPLFDVRGTWEVTLAGADTKPFFIVLKGKPTDLKGEAHLEMPPKPEATKEEPNTDAAKDKPKDAPEEQVAEPTKEKETTQDKKEKTSSSLKLEHVGLRDARLGFTVEGERWGRAGVAHMSAVLLTSPASELTWAGAITWADATVTEFTAKRTAVHVEESKTEETASKEKDGKKKIDPAASFPVNYPLGAFGRSAPPERPRFVLFKNATIWTSGPAGVLASASLLVRDGKITNIGNDIAAPEGAVVIDAQGKHLSPGIIDCHSHMATDGGVNETGRAVTCQVRVGDFMDSNDVNIYRQLAGGVTTSHILHGSANPIGGQSQVMKLRWGEVSEKLKFAQAPPTVKFALGENVKQSNWERNSGRYPQTRMGVEELMRDEFQAARDYQNAWRRWEQEHVGLPPRRDLELECIAEVLDGKRWVHCHSYRQDEILAFVRLMEGFHVKIGCLQHILEGYKVADVLAKHGATGSSFSDWWAYKYEVWDAIPYNGAVMHRAGVNVSFNSDDRELARHLNQEAAKAVKYGGVDPVEAFKFVTINPAMQLRIEQYVGSLEQGKDADLVLWSASPLSNYARPEQTWIDGRKYFDLAEDKQLREQVRTIRATLAQKVLASGEEMRTLGEDYATDKDLWPRDDEFCHAHPHAENRRDRRGNRGR